MKKLFKKYINSILIPGEFSRFSDFISQKKNDRIIYDFMNSAWNKQLKETEIESKPNPSLFRKIKEEIWLEKQKIAQRKIKIYSWGMSVAAILVVALLLSNILFLNRDFMKQQPVQLQTIVTPPGAKTNFVLPDGSSVWLNSDSKLSFPVRFDKNRPVELVGEAFFEVVKNDKPFVVNTKYGNVEVKGTSFNVKAYSDDNSFATTLEEGIIEFNSNAIENGVVLNPGEHLAKTPKGVLIKKVDTKYYTSWKDGKLLFAREPFPDFIKKLERWYNVKIEYNDSDLDELWYTGTIEMESISEVMELISRAAPVSYNFDNKTRIFTIKAK